MSKLIYTRVNKQHPICSWRAPKDMTAPMRRFYSNNYLGCAHFAQVVRVKGEVVAFLRYYVVNKTFYDLGTYVLVKYRGMGIGKKLWTRALQHIKPKVVKVNMISRGGGKLISSLQKKHKNINFKAVKAYS